MAKVFFFILDFVAMLYLLHSILTPCKICEVWRTNNRKCFYADGLLAFVAVLRPFTNLLKRFQQSDGKFIWAMLL